MPAIPLPENASLEHLKNQAKLVRQLVASGDNDALALVCEFHPRFAGLSLQSSPPGIKLSDAQLVVARLYGHSSWTKLRAHLDIVGQHTRPDPSDVDPTDEVNRFISLACVSYHPDNDALDRIEAARAMQRTSVGLSTASIAAAAVAGNHAWLAEQIAHDPQIANLLCGPNQWPPLLYCCYSRLDDPTSEYSTLTTAKMLLDAGADPNAGFLWRGLLPPFTALTGAFGRGEADQPPHPAALDLARLLLVAGADPNDGQALYNCGLAGSAHDDAAHLALLVEFGLGTVVDGPWYRRFGARLTAPEQLLYDELEVAAHRGLPNRLRFLIRIGLDINRPVGRSRRTPWQLATDAGNTEVLDLLLQSAPTMTEEPR